MELLRIIILSVSFSSILTAKANQLQLSPCNYTAIYNFGDSNSDTGGIAAVFYPPAPPFGETFFHRPVGRASDGRLIIDFIADYLGIPYLSPYLDSIGSSYRYGANFATGGATIMRPNESWFENSVSPFPLEIQVEQYTQFKDRTAYFVNGAKKKSARKRLPRPKDFVKALFTLDIGQNDVAAGFGDPFQICCGFHGIGYDVWCGNKGNVNGSEVFADSCAYPSLIISWDGVHYTEAANRWIANRIINGSLSDPPIAIDKACHKQL